MVKVDATIFCCISAVLTEYVFENLHVFYSFEILHVTNFTMINERLFFARV